MTTSPILAWLILSTPDRKAPMPSSFKDLRDRQAADASTKAAADAAKLKADADAAASTVAFAHAIKAAPGGFVADTTASPAILYTSPDGNTFAVQPIASITDAAPGTDPEITVSTPSSPAPDAPAPAPATGTDTVAKDA